MSSAQIPSPMTSRTPSQLSAQFHVPIHFDVHFGKGLIQDQAGAFSTWIREHQPPKILLVLDGGLAQANPHLLKTFQHQLKQLGYPEVPHVTCRAGEAAKNDAQDVESISKACWEHRICRHSVIIAVGGGALLDVAGYAAATVHRGVKLIRFPSTVLSQNDSAMGVKNGINTWGKKNFTGCFTPPDAVFCDTDLLKTLPERERRAGLSEAIKVALLKDADFFGWISSHARELAQGEESLLSELIFRSAKLHLQHITQGGDPFEKGSSRPLDFGHWLAHRLESMTEHQLRHGEAVAIGMAVDVRYAEQQGWLSPKESKSILQTITSCGLNLSHDVLQNTEAIFKGLSDFREHLGGRLTIVNLKGIAQPFDVHEIDEAVMKDVLLNRSDAPLA
jgi:3-dehydroquinate synthase